MHQSIDYHHPPPTRGRLVIEQFVYFDIVATVLGKFEVDLPRQSWLRGKLPLFNQLVVATVWGSRVCVCVWGGVIAVNRRRKVKYPLFWGRWGAGWRLWLCCCCYWPFGQSISQVCCFLRNTTTSKVSLASNKSRHGSQKVLPSCLIVRR